MIVTGVDAQSVAAERVMPGDVIMQTNQPVVAAPGHRFASPENETAAERGQSSAAELRADRHGHWSAPDASVGCVKRKHMNDPK